MIFIEHFPIIHLGLYRIASIFIGRDALLTLEVPKSVLHALV
jgi:hypothetical protein